jgi:hypothetical protein
VIWFLSTESVGKETRSLELTKTFCPASEKNVTVAAPDLGLIGNAMTRMPAYMATLQMQAALIAFQLQDLNSNAINPTSEVHLACVFNTHAGCTSDGICPGPTYRLSSPLPPNWAIANTLR